MSKMNMKVLTQQKCSECNGYGVGPNPEWTEVYKWEDEYREEHNGEYPTMEEVEKKFYDKGYQKLPPEELPCGECDGKGVIESWISVEELFKMAEV